MLQMVQGAKRDSMEAADVTTKLEATHIRPESPQTQPLGLADLPASVRNRVYSHLLDTELVNVGKPNVAYSHSIKDSILKFTASRPPFPVATALFYVSKSISAEARHFFHSKNLFVRLSVYSDDARHAKTMLEDSGVLFSTAAPDHVERCKSHALELRIVEKSSAQRRALVLFPAQYLPRLINFFDQASRASSSWAPNHSISLSVINTFDIEIPRVQGDLLELFRLLTHFGTVMVEGISLLSGYADSLQKCMTASAFSPGAWLTSVTDMIVRSEKAWEKKQYITAAHHAQAAIISMTYAFLTRAETLHLQPESFQRAIQRLRWQTELSLAKALYSKHSILGESPQWLMSTSVPSKFQKEAATDLLAAETAASHALSLSTDSPSPASNPWCQTLPPELIPSNKADWFDDNESGKTWHVLGLVHMALGEYLFAAGDLERAQGLCKPSNPEIVTAFKKAREGIDWKVRPGFGLRKAAKVARLEID